jgi:NAD(P)-dependent dehydrogenase (short-subunit alcohol dehydrogenase family)
MIHGDHGFIRRLFAWKATVIMPNDLGSLFRLDNKIALVVGAASGIGRAAAEGLAANGATVICSDVNEAGAAAVTEAIAKSGGRSASMPLDISRAAQIDSTFEQIVSRYGTLDVLFTTPAINVRKAFLNYTDDELSRVIDLNLKGTFRVMRAAGRIMSDKGKGSIIVCSSIRSLVVEPGQSVYAATKAGVLQLARGLACELGPKGVRVNAVGPGVIETPLTKPILDQPSWRDAYASKNALSRWGKAQEMVGPVVFLASDAASYVTGTILFVDGGWTAIDGRFTPPL